KHDINLEIPDIPVEVEIIPVNTTVSLGSIAAVSNMTIDDITLLNPSYIQQVIKGTPNKPQYLVLPKTHKVYYSLVYDVLNGMAISQARLQAANALFFQANKQQSVIRTTKSGNFDT